MKWILFILLFSVDGNQIKIVNNFDTKAACQDAVEAAAAVLMNNKKAGPGTAIYCLPNRKEE